jgi:UDP-N-acetylmuramoylalanine--D-glutamate ligase
LSGTVTVVGAASMREAVSRAYDAAKPDGVVLLAPACSSFDWFRDYADRGDTFKREVAQLIEKERGRES